MDLPTWMKIGTEARKFGVAIGGLCAVLLANDLLPDGYDQWAAVVLAVLTATGVYRAQNTPSEASAEAILARIEALSPEALAAFHDLTPKEN